MNARIFAALAAGLLILGSAQAQAPAKTTTSQPAKVSAEPTAAVAQAVKTLIQQRFAGMDVTAVRRTPYGLFEVQVGDSFFYTDEKVTWVMEGPLIDAVTRRDMTRASQEKLLAISFDQLPLDLAIKRVKGDGSRKLAIFEDPNCGYCKMLSKTLEGVDNVTIYTFLFPILSQDSKDKVRDVWCAKNPIQTWENWMLRGQKPQIAHCDVPEDKWLALGKRLMVRGTPTLFFADGSRAPGALTLEELKARLN